MKKLFMLLLAAGLLAACGNDEPEKKDVSKIETEEKQNDSTAKPAESEDKAQKEDVPREYRNALKSAQNYLSIMPMSEKGLYEQLTSEHGDKYPAEAAQYAIDNVEADYNEQALKAAENYQEIMPMSDQELFEQLTSEHGDKYTEEQAQYAIDNLAD